MSWPTAKQEHRHSGFFVSPTGIEVHTVAGARTLSFSLLSNIAQEVIAKMALLINDALPDGHRHCYQDFRWDQLEDSLFEHNSIFLQEKNNTLLTPMITAIYNTLQESFHRPGPPSNSNLAAKNWLRLDDTILSALCCAIALTCGVPPRDFQLAAFQYHYDETTGEKRNLFIVDQSVCLANPKAKQLDKVTQECLWALPSPLAKPVVFYLGILRPVVILVMKNLQLSAPFHATHIFVHTIPGGLDGEKNIHQWGGASINGSIKRWTSESPISLDARFLRDAFTLVLKTFVPHLFQLDVNRADLVDLQGQHTKDTSIVHYGRSFQIPRSLGMSTERAKMYISASKTLHWVYGLGSPSGQTLDALQAPVTFSTLKNARVALESARWLIMLHYGIGWQATKEENSAIVDNVLERKPFYHDKVLPKVLKILRHGFAPLPPLYIPPPAGCSAAESGLAIRLVSVFQEYMES